LGSSEKPIVILSADLLRHISRIKSPDRQDHPRVLFNALAQTGVKLYREQTMILGKRVRVAANKAAVDLIEKADDTEKRKLLESLSREAFHVMPNDL
jgi:hypothetical protein